MSHSARLQVSQEYVVDSLHLPPGTEIVSVRMSPERFGDLELTVRHDSLPEIAQGAATPQVSVEVERYVSRYLVDGKA